MLHTPEQVERESARRLENFKSYLHGQTYQDKLKLRLKINDACGSSPEARARTWDLCARPDNPVEGCIFFIENFGWTFDPRPHTPMPHLPFILFDYQKEGIKWIIDHIDRGYDGLVEKSRDMGISWVLFFGFQYGIGCLETVLTFLWVLIKKLLWIIDLKTLCSVWLIML